VRRERLRAVIAGGTEAWRVASSLADVGIAVILDPLANMPADFDKIGATLENAARLHRAGVTIAFSFFRDEPIRTPRLRQAAGNAVANGLPAEAALAAMTRIPAEIFGVGKLVGTVEVGKLADLVLWSGDPLEVTTYAERVFAGGRAIDMRSRETQLRDRYLPKPLPSK
jgi:imidazolonepropionase-like amidohydrolase